MLMSRSITISVDSIDGTINQNRVSEMLGVFLESESDEVDLIFDLTNDL